ncbi:MAG: hypothetical protein WEC14_06355 [Chloroflexota bacterium]
MSKRSDDTPKVDQPAEPADQSAAPPRAKVQRARATTVGKATAPRRAPKKAPVAVPVQAGEPAEPVAVVAHGAPRPPSITITQGGLSEAAADAIDVHQGGIGRAKATDIALSQGGIGLAQGGRISVEMGGIGLAVAREARVSQGGVQTMLARDVRFEQGIVGTIAANHVTVQQPAFVGIVLARHVHGEVRALLDWRGGLALGVVVGLLSAVLRRR